MQVIFELLAEGVAAGLDAVPALRSRLPCLAGIALPSALRQAAWSSSLLYRDSLAQVRLRLRASPLSYGAEGVAAAERSGRFKLPTVAHRLMARGLRSFRDPSTAITSGFTGLGSPEIADDTRALEVRACALLLQVREGGPGELPTAIGSLSLPMAYVLAEVKTGEDAEAATDELTPSRMMMSASASKRLQQHVPPLPPHLTRSGTGPPNALLEAIERPLEPIGVTMLMRVLSHGVVDGVKAATDDATGVWPLIEKRWPRLLSHLLGICQRDDLADISARWEGKQPPRSMLHRIVAEEWIEHGFVGSLPREALLWVWDQFMMQGWAVCAEVAAACLFIIRREVRRLDHAAAGATELRGALRAQLHHDLNICELQALLASASAATRATVSGGATDGKTEGTEKKPYHKEPQVMLRLPIVRPVQAEANPSARRGSSARNESEVLML